MDKNLKYLMGTKFFIETNQDFVETTQQILALHNWHIKFVNRFLFQSFHRNGPYQFS